MAIILVCVCIFKMADMNVSMSHISANDVDRKLIFVYTVYVDVFRVNESKYGNYIVPAIVFSI